ALTLDQSGTGLLKFTSTMVYTGTTSSRTLVLQGATAGTGDIGGTLSNPSGTGYLSVTKSGAGTWTLSGTNTYQPVSGAGGVTLVNGGCLVLGSASALPGGIAATGGLSPLTFNGGVVGLGAGDFTRLLAAAGTATGVNFTGAGGWAAYGADRVVNLGGASDTVSWATPGTGLNGQTLILGNATATNTVDFQNPLDLAAATRSVQVDKGSAAIDAKLSGNLTNGNLTKTGLGTLALTGANTYTGTTTVSAGTLLVNGTNSGAGLVSVASGATLGGTGILAGAATFSTGAKAVFTVTCDPVTLANTTPLTISGVMTYTSTVVHLNLPVGLPSGTYTLATSSATPAGTLSATPVVDSGSYAAGFTSAVVSLDTTYKKLLLTVNGLPTHPTQLAITAVNGGASPVADAGFSVVVQAQDTNGLIRPVLANTVVNLSLYNGNGPLIGNLTGTLLAGTTATTLSGVTYGTAESGVVLTATRSSGDSLTAANSAPFTVLPSPTPTYLTVTGFPIPQSAGSPGSVTVTCKTPSGGTATTYTGTVHFTSTAMAAGLPADYTFVSGDNGVHSFSGVTLGTAGTQAITATDTVAPSITGTQSAITVTPGAATALIVAGYPSPLAPGVVGSLTVTAKDAYNNTANAYAGTIHFTSSDNAASLPANYPFTGGDAGTHAFTHDVTLNTLGLQSITATDMVTPTITGTQSAITVWNPPTSFTWRNDVTGNWNDATNWTQTNGLDYAPLAAGQSDYTLNFIAGTYTASQDLNDGFLVNQLNFAGAVTLAGNNGLALTGTQPSLNQNSASGVIISAPVSLAANASVAGSGSGQVDYAGLISGTGSLTKSSSGVLKIYGLNPNTYSGGTIVNSGTLHVGTMIGGSSPLCAGVLGTGPVTLGSGTTIECDNITATNSLVSNGGTIYSSNSSGATWSGPITLNADTHFNTAYKMTCSGGIDGPASLIKTGSDTLILPCSNTYSGPTTISAGTLQCDVTTALGAGALSISTGAMLNLNHSGTQSVASLTLGGVPQAGGTYGSSASDATFQNDTYFAGSGTVTLGSLYDIWANGTFANGTLTDKNPAHDPNGTGMTNFEKFAFGLDPTTGTSTNPISQQLDSTTGTFKYTRTKGSGLTYTVMTSTDLVTWTPDAGTGIAPITTNGSVETVEFTVTSAPVNGKLFVRVEAIP
ncbi:MAG: autotransporter-associated beta strand repeat-containing protein, partial [Verrucomicrobiota bacterium]